MAVGLKFLQWFIRGVQLACSLIVLAISAFFLVALRNNNLSASASAAATTTNLNLPATAGISGAAALYAATGLLLLCCLAGHNFTSFVAIVADLALAAAFVYVAVAYRAGAGSCEGLVSTPLGDGPADGTPTSAGNQGLSGLPTLRIACKLQSAALAVAIVAVIFFVLSMLVEFALVRQHHKERRFGPIPNNGNYTSGKPSFFNAFRRRGGFGAHAVPVDENALPMHTSPNQVRPSYAGSDTTAVAPDNSYPKYEGAYATNATAAQGGYGHENGTTGTATVPPANYRYNDGVYDRV